MHILECHGKGHSIFLRHNPIVINIALNVNNFILASKITHLKEKVDKVGVLLEFGTDYTKELDLLIFCGSSQNLATQADQFLRGKTDSGNNKMSDYSKKKKINRIKTRVQTRTEWLLTCTGL